MLILNKIKRVVEEILIIESDFIRALTAYGVDIIES
jgi:hypothetical protein